MVIIVQANLKKKKKNMEKNKKFQIKANNYKTAHSIVALFSIIYSLVHK
jgi:hypothetical protein